MTLSVELQLLALAIGLYAHDSILLLFSNEGVLTSTGKDKWRVLFGSDKARLRGKELLLPNLLLVHRPIFRLSWDYEGAFDKARSEVDWGAKRDVLMGLMPIIYVVGLAQFVVFPYVIFFYLTNISLVAALVLLYGAILIALACVIYRRKVFGISDKKLFSLCFECLICPPIAVNLVRKLSLGCSATDDLVVVARTMLSDSDWQSAKNKFISRLNEEIEDEDEESTRLIKLREYRDGLCNESR